MLSVYEIVFFIAYCLQLVALKNWSKAIMQKVTQGGETLSTQDFGDAIEILKGEFDSAVSQLCSSASTMLGSVVKKLRKHCLRILHRAVETLRKELLPEGMAAKQAGEAKLDDAKAAAEKFGKAVSMKTREVKQI